MRMRRRLLLPLGQRRRRRLPRPERRRRAPRCPRPGPGRPRAAVDAGVGVRAGHELAVRARRLPPNQRNRGLGRRRRFRPCVARAPTERVPAGVVPGHERRVGTLHRLVRGAVHGVVVVRVRTETSMRHRRRRRRRRRGILGVAGRRARRGVTGGASAVVVRLVRGHEERLVVRHAADSANPSPPETTRGLPCGLPAPNVTVIATAGCFGFLRFGLKTPMTVTRKQLQTRELLVVNDVTDPLTEMGPNENQKSGEPKRKGREMVPDHRSSHDQRERRWPREERA